jgi:hypothetical protein
MFGNRIQLMSLLVLTGLSLGVALFFYLQWHDARSPVVENKTVQKEVEKIVETISELVFLPENEEVELVTLDTEETIRSSAFFAHAEVGDVLLVYRVANRVVLYRPSTEKVIETGAVGDIGKTQNTDISSGEVPSSESMVPENTVVRVAYYNGSGINGRAAEYERQMKEWFLNTETITRENALQSYNSSIVIDLQGRFGIETEEIARRIGGVVGDFPPGERRPAADILIIIGTN